MKYMLCPVENSASLWNMMKWVQVRPRVTQKFGVDFYQNGKLVYGSMGMKGHNGIDFGVPVGTPVYAPFSGRVRVKDDGRYGYGRHIKLRSDSYALEAVLAHLDSFDVRDGDLVEMGQVIGRSGNTGFSTGAHLHFGVRRLNRIKDLDVFKWVVEDYYNGFYGYFDVEPNLVTFKGTLLSSSILK